MYAEIAAVFGIPQEEVAAADPQPPADERVVNVSRAEYARLLADAGFGPDPAEEAAWKQWRELSGLPSREGS